MRQAALSLNGMSASCDKADLEIHCIHRLQVCGDVLKPRVFLQM